MNVSTRIPRSDEPLAGLSAEHGIKTTQSHGARRLDRASFMMCRRDWVRLWRFVELGDPSEQKWVV
jgi:hypothetical protein